MSLIYKYFIALSLLLFLGLGLLHWSQRSSSQADAASRLKDGQLSAIYSRCVSDMLASTCKVMGASTVKVTAKPGELVFVAGVGAIDAIEYQALYAAGDAMCTVVRQACQSAWEGAQCKTARRLYL